MNATLPQWAADIVANPPRSPDGIHNWFFRCSRALWKCRRTESEIREILENAAATCGRFVPDREIDDAIKNSRTSAFQPISDQYRAWPKVNHERRNEIISTGKTLADLWEASPWRLEDNESHTEELIDKLFPGNPLLCCGKNHSDFATKAREEWRGQLSGQALIVPSPMVARTGKTQNGKESAHSLSNTGKRHYLVIEQDRGTIDEQAAILLHLAANAPLTLVVHSGNRSVHGWFACHDQTEEQLRVWMWVAVSLGADPALWTRSQFTRIPDGLRDNGKRQRVYFFFPEATK